MALVRLPPREAMEFDNHNLYAALEMLGKTRGRGLTNVTKQQKEEQERLNQKISDGKTFGT
jgi:hypothetical protein